MAPRSTKKTAAAAEKKEPKKTIAKKTGAATASSSAEDVGRPKAAVSAYVHWYREHKDEVAASKKLKNLSKAAHRVWNKLEDKSPWEKLAREDKERYHREMAAYKNDHPVVAGADETQ